MWKTEKCIKKEQKFNNPVLISGLPGIGNVGKIVVDYIISEKKGRKIADFYSESLTPSVLINEKNLIDFPKISLSYVSFKSRDIIFLHGDFQPLTDKGFFSFCDEVLRFSYDIGVKEIISLAGIGLKIKKEKPRFFITSYDKNTVDKYKKSFPDFQTDLYGYVGPIVGINGLLVGKAKDYNIPGLILLTETVSDPMYIGFNESIELVSVLNKILSIDVDPKDLKENSKLSSDIIKKVEEIIKGQEVKDKNDISYIG